MTLYSRLMTEISTIPGITFISIARFKLAVMFFLLAGITPSASSFSLSGHWEGAVVRDGAIQTIVIDFSIAEERLTGTYNIPDMGLFAEPLEEIAYESPSLSFHFFWGTFTCIVHEDVSEITGLNENWGPPVKIHLKRSPALELHREEQVHFKSKDLILRGSLLIPRGKGPHPAVVVIHGSGGQGRHLWTYRSYGYLLARYGIAALLYDKRGVGESEGNYEQADFKNLAQDAVEAVKLLKTRTDIDKDKIGLIGISQGGWIAPLAASMEPDVAFLILMVAPSVTVWEQELQRVEYSLRQDGFTETEIAAAIAHTTLLFAAVENRGLWDSLQASMAFARQSSWAEYVVLLDSLPELDDWQRIRFDPEPILKKTTIPTLVIYGEGDVLVPPSGNASRMRQLLTEAGNTDVTVITFPGVDHDLMTGHSLIGGAWKWPDSFWRWNRKAPGLFETVREWALERFKP
jgi:pimeloyl-ACP methyl ester carboxylesterase